MTTKKLNARQARWAEFLSHFYFLIRYRPGKQNPLADALTRRDDEAEHDTRVTRDEHRMQIMLKPEHLDDRIKHEVQPRREKQATIAPLELELLLTDQLLQTNRASPSLEENRQSAGRTNSPWTLEDGLLLYKSKLAIPKDDKTLQTKVLDEVHRQASTAHPGRNKTMKLVGARYYWPGWRRYVEEYIRNCRKCRRAENPRDRPPGLLQPLPVPERPWQHISMDYRSFPLDQHGYDSALVIVDRLSKKVVSIPCHKTNGARELAQMFITHVYRHYGAPETIVSDRGPQFISEFWTEFCRILGIKLKLLTAHHAPIDGQTEIVNQHITMRLRPFISYYQDNWSELLPLMDHAAAILPHESTGLSPFMVDRGFEPRTSFDWKPIPENLAAPARMDRQTAINKAKRMEEIWKHARENMTRAQARQREQADRHRREVDFNVGDYVWLSLKAYRTARPSRKLDDQMAGPYRVLEKVGHAYRLELPPTMRIHPVFSPDKLRRAANDPVPGQVIDPPDPIIIEGEEEWEVEEVLASRVHRGRLEYHVKWTGYDDDPAWYPARNFKGAPHRLREFHERYPEAPGPPIHLARWLR
ncbi:MAG TPA: DDE-type integrase/transposase/recombinase, partial [Ktedonobacteraceae bacterium]|nr:DDE-type integrase/transposase/recombinase [Ktedonobacteraceae bacterium]